MSFSRGPTMQQLQAFSDQFNFQSTPEELEVYKGVITHSLEDYSELWGLCEEAEDQEFPRTAGHRPGKDENPLNAWYWRCDVAGRASGLLSGKTVALKDNIFLAGVPLMNGSRALEGFVPTSDATVVTRLLQQGGRVLGKATCEDLCLSGASYHTTYGPVRNPWSAGHTSGGSSSGVAALVASGAVDVGIGGDQGGSVRIPASCCGLVGLKPTWGLVPFTGVAPIETTLDHVGPLTRDVADCAALLEAIAGFDDNKDMRQPSNGFVCPRYTEEMKRPLESGLRIGVIKEGFEGCEDAVVDTVRAAITLIKDSGKFATVEDISIPMQSKGVTIWTPIGIQGTVDQMITGARQNGQLSWALSEKLRQGFRSTGPSHSHNVKFITMLGAHVNKECGPAQTMALALRRKYDEALAQFDFLLLPTLTELPCKLPSKDTPTEELIANSLSPIRNTAGFDVTHHPALSLNAGFGGPDGLPVGLQLVARHWQESGLLRMAAAIEEILRPAQTRRLPEK